MIINLYDGKIEDKNICSAKAGLRVKSYELFYSDLEDLLFISKSCGNIALKEEIEKMFARMIP